MSKKEMDKTYLEQESLSLPEIQQASFEVLKKFAKFCDAHGFTYYLAYGTLIGAIRHKGFIPWDDDVDVWMPRADYDRFLEVFESHKEEFGNYKLCTRINTKNYEYYIPRLSDMSYRYITTVKGELDFDIGAFIDIYPLDNLCSTEEEGKALLNTLLRKNIVYSIYNNGKSYASGFSLVKRYATHLILRLVKGKNYGKRINAEMDAILKKNTSENDKYIGVSTWESLFVQYERYWFAKTVDVEFHGEFFKAPVEYDKILRLCYGDYMQLPPEEQRKPRHDYKMIKRTK